MREFIYGMNMDIHLPPPNHQAEVVADLRCILGKHGIRHCAVGGHSYGTIWAGWIIRALREHVKQAILLDPVSRLAERECRGGVSPEP